MGDDFNTDLVIVKLQIVILGPERNMLELIDRLWTGRCRLE